MRRTSLVVVVLAFLSAAGVAMAESDSPILPLPKHISPARPATSTAQPGTRNHPAAGASEIIPLPLDRPKPPKTSPKAPPPAGEGAPLISLPAEPPPPPDEPIPPLEPPPEAISPDIPPPPPGNVNIPGEIVVEGQTPAGTPAAAPVTALPIFPKDTSSAIFMVMKTWECENYDGKTLLEHSLGVYGQEAEDQFTAKGLDQLPTFALTLKEDDITLDELLDIVAQKSNTDWGVDISQKIIYFYPAPRQ